MGQGLTQDKLADIIGPRHFFWHTINYGTLFALKTIVPRHPFCSKSNSWIQRQFSTYLSDKQDGGVPIRYQGQLTVLIFILFSFLWRKEIHTSTNLPKETELYMLVLPIIPLGEKWNTIKIRISVKCVSSEMPQLLMVHQSGKQIGYKPI